MSEVFHDVIGVADFPADGKFVVAIGGWTVLVCQVDGAFYAVNDRCSHAASPLSGGRIRRGTVMCPLHGARFELATGNCVGAAYPRLRQFALQVTDGRIAVAVPDGPPGMEDIAVRAV